MGQNRSSVKGGDEGTAAHSPVEPVVGFSEDHKRQLRERRAQESSTARLAAKQSEPDVPSSGALSHRHVYEDHRPPPLTLKRSNAATVNPASEQT